MLMVWFSFKKLSMYNHLLLLGSLVLASVTQALVPLGGQCGGLNWTGETKCAEGVCVVFSIYYFQCQTYQTGLTTAAPKPTYTSYRSFSTRSGLPTTTCSPPPSTATSSTASPTGTNAPRVIRGNFEGSGSTTGLLLYNYYNAARVATTGNSFTPTEYSATGGYLSIVTMIFNNCKIRVYLAVEQSAYSYKKLYWATGGANYWAVSPGNYLGTTASSPFGVVTNFIACDPGFWELYLQTGTDIPTSQTGVVCSAPFKLRMDP